MTFLRLMSVIVEVLDATEADFETALETEARERRERADQALERAYDSNRRREEY